MKEGRKRRLLLVSSIEDADYLGHDGDADGVAETLGMLLRYGRAVKTGAVHDLVYFDPDEQSFVSPVVKLEWAPLSPKQAAAKIAASQRHGVEPIFERDDATQLLIAGLKATLDEERRKHSELLEGAREETDDGMAALAEAQAIPVKDRVKSLECVLGEWMARVEATSASSVQVRKT